jgi:hypothetical protein
MQIKGRDITELKHWCLYFWKPQPYIFELCHTHYNKNIYKYRTSILYKTNRLPDLSKPTLILYNTWGLFKVKVEKQNTIKASRRYSDHTPIIFRTKHIRRGARFRIKHHWLTLHNFKNSWVDDWIAQEGTSWSEKYKNMRNRIVQWSTNRETPHKKVQRVQ